MDIDGSRPLESESDHDVPEQPRTEAEFLALCTGNSDRSNGQMSIGSVRICYGVSKRAYRAIVTECADWIETDELQITTAVSSGGNAARKSLRGRLQDFMQTESLWKSDTRFGIGNTTVP
jgi:tRNA A37 threonylcarbamoyltransferase TsaD